MDASGPSGRPSGKGKRKYDSGHIMRAGSNFINRAGSSDDTPLSRPFRTRTYVFQPLETPTGPLGEKSIKGDTPSPVPTTSGSILADPINTLTFINSTIDDFKSHQPSAVQRSDQDSPLRFQDWEHAGPRLRLSTAAQPDQKLMLRPSRPLANSAEVNSDVWQVVFGYCEPKHLLEVKTVNSAFYRMLSDRSAIWKESRQNYYGRDMPDCPQGLTEQQYVDLLAGRGCQSSTCPNENAARVFWTFQVRLCAKCFKEMTMRPDDLPLQRRHIVQLWKDQKESSIDLWGLLPMARSDGRRYVQPRSINENANDWKVGTHTHHFAFLKSSYTKLEAAYLDLLSRAPLGSGVLAQWVSSVHRETMASMAEAKKMEAWHKLQNTPDKDLQQVRTEYFEARAAQLSPPMPPQILWNMAAFRRVVRVPQAPSERSWRTLRAKITPYREQAEQVEKFKTAMAQGHFSPVSPSVKLFQKLHDHRSGHKHGRERQREQNFVLRLGKEQLASCLRRKVADADLLLLCLKQVYEAYEQLKETGARPVGLNFDGSTGPYILTLDDARMIVNEVVMEEISPRSQRGEVVFRTLKCRGCQRSDFVKTWSFTGAFEHMLETHARQVGEGFEFWRFAIPYGSCKHSDYENDEEEDGGDDDAPFRFPWYRVPWPKCLPLTPSHQDPRELGQWHPESREPYLPLQIRTTVSAFEGRQPRQNQNPETDFVGNLVFAARTLRGVQLHGSCQMKIALKYAVDRYAAAAAVEPPLSMFRESFESIREANPAIDLKFRCGVCVGDEDIIQSAKHVKYRVAVENLVIHWEEKHRKSAGSWAQSLMRLPSDSEVMEQIEKADDLLQQEKDLAKARTAELPTNVRKRPRLKANVVMQMRSASEALDELFPR